MKDLERKFQEMLLHDSNNKIKEFNEVCNYISQYSQVNTFLIPKKYQETLTDYLDETCNNIKLPIVYEFHDSNDPDVVMLTLFNFGVIQRENLLEKLKEQKEALEDD